MPEYCFFKRGAQIAALERTDAEKTAQLSRDGWEKLFEEVHATDAKSALARLADMRKEEIPLKNQPFTAGFFIMSGTGNEFDSSYGQK